MAESREKRLKVTSANESDSAPIRSLLAASRNDRRRRPKTNRERVRRAAHGALDFWPRQADECAWVGTEYVARFRCEHQFVEVERFALGRNELRERETARVEIVCLHREDRAIDEFAGLTSAGNELPVALG